MVASLNSDLYTPFPHNMILEEGPQSSEEGSGLHSPVFGAPFAPPHGDNNIRYQLNHPDVHHAAGILAAQFDYNAPSLAIQQPPLLNAHIEIPSSGPHQHVTYTSNFSLSRNQLDSPIQSTTEKSRLPPPPVHGGDAVLDYSFSTSQRRLPGSQSHDQSLPRPTGTAPGMSLDGDHKASAPSAERTETSPASKNSPRESRKESSTLVIACRQCRARKIRCDSTRPACNNCHRRSNDCQYDAVPKRRGPDKRPGTRQRSCKKRPADGSAPPPPKRSRKTSERQTEDRDPTTSRVKENMVSGRRTPPPPRHLDRSQGATSQIHAAPAPGDLRISTDTSLMKPELSPVGRRVPDYGYDQGYVKPYPRTIDVNILGSSSGSHQKFPAPSSPTVEYDQRVWWETFTRTYSLQEISDDLTYLFKDTGHWLSFLNLDFFTSSLFNPEDRLHIQPSFILAGLALAVLMKSSELEGGSNGRGRALWFRNAAQEALNKAWRSEWIDAQLAEAAFMLSLFEMSVHPQYDPDRVVNSLVFLDNIIRHVSLTSVDAHDPDVAIFPTRTVPMIPQDLSNDSLVPPHERKCSCIPTDAAHPPDAFSTWAYPLPWDSSWTEVQVRDEECRRLCWSALSLVSTYTSQCAAFNRDPPNLFLTDPSNYAILFPGEVMDRMSPAYRSSDSPSPKESVWALYCRSMLLWTFCNRIRVEGCSDEDKAEYASEAWSETQAIQDSIDMHNCNLDTGLMYMTKEYLQNTRMMVTQSLRSLQGLDSGRSAPVPMFSSKQVQEWLYYQDQVIKRVKISIQNLGKTSSHQLLRRPFQVTWFSNQLAICLLLWNQNHECVDAITLAKSILIPLDVLNVLWPSPVHQHQCNEMRNRLSEACSVLGLDPPHPPSYSIPPALRFGPLTP
ncbi:hypothetical protein EYR40_006147 [Pleurotus pulmonarius]|nr:hypothetical protein EYR36_010770 [Pleurotus pulmonarius]KAF4580544.1 hypothetical protein EYR38_003143 [Pleurotus pulmonarius]KAF4599058.1 hypothetical protein EYR40_006147 [Pleurotus pulmonarius]